MGYVCRGRCLGKRFRGLAPSVVGYTHSFVKVTKVVLHADRTEVSCHVHYPSGYWIQILRTAELQADGRNFPVRDASGIPLGEQYTMPENGEVTLR